MQEINSITIIILHISEYRNLWNNPNFIFIDSHVVEIVSIKNETNKREMFNMNIRCSCVNVNFSLILRCSLLFAGRPQPQVRWLVNAVLVDDQYEHNTGDVIENRLLWPSVQRTDLNSIFTCQAVNTILVEPKENSYILDLHCKYLYCIHLFVYFFFIYFALCSFSLHVYALHFIFHCFLHFRKVLLDL